MKQHVLMQNGASIFSIADVTTDDDRVVNNGTYQVSGDFNDSSTGRLVYITGASNSKMDGIYAINTEGSIKSDPLMGGPVKAKPAAINALGGAKVQFISLAHMDLSGTRPKYGTSDVDTAAMQYKYLDTEEVNVQQHTYEDGKPNYKVSDYMASGTIHFTIDNTPLTSFHGFLQKDYLFEVELPSTSSTTNVPPDNAEIMIINDTGKHILLNNRTGIVNGHNISPTTTPWEALTTWDNAYNIRSITTLRYSQQDDTWAALDANTLKWSLANLPTGLAVKAYVMIPFVNGAFARESGSENDDGKRGFIFRRAVDPTIPWDIKVEMAIKMNAIFGSDFFTGHNVHAVFEALLTGKSTDEQGLTFYKLMLAYVPEANGSNFAFKVMFVQLDEYYEKIGDATPIALDTNTHLDHIPILSMDESVTNNFSVHEPTEGATTNLFDSNWIEFVIDTGYNMSNTDIVGPYFEQKTFDIVDTSGGNLNLVVRPNIVMWGANDAILTHTISANPKIAADSTNADSTNAESTQIQLTTSHRVAYPIISDGAPSVKIISFAGVEFELEVPAVEPSE